MSNQERIKASDIQLLKIEVVQNKIDASGYKKAKATQFKIAHNLQHILSEDKVKIELSVLIEDQHHTELVSMQINFHYHISYLNRFYSIQDDKPVFRKQLVSNLLAIAVSSARGIVYEKMGNNGVPDVLIPVVDARELV